MLAEGHLPWPEGEKGNVLLDVLVDKPVDDAFLLLFSGENELRVGPLHNSRSGIRSPAEAAACCNACRSA